MNLLEYIKRIAEFFRELISDIKEEYDIIFFTLIIKYYEMSLYGFIT